MLDIGWSELVLIGVAALIFVGPKDLPRMFFALGKMTAKARGMAREFQRAMDDAAKTSGLDDIKKDINGLKTGVTAVTNPSALGINALEDAARKFEKWDPKTVLKPAAATAVVEPAAADAAVGTGSQMGAETKALAEKRAADAAAARAKAHELQAKAAQSASATFQARAKADAEAAAAKAAAAPDGALADAKPKVARPKAARPAATPVAAPVSGATGAGPDGVGADGAEVKPARKPPVRRKKSEA